jgi:hypothetical protein
MSRERLVSSYRNARKSLEEGDLINSIKHLESYSKELPEDISYEPHYWLVGQYLKANNFIQAFDSASFYLKGCTPAHAVIKAKLFSSWFQDKGSQEYSFALIRLSSKYQKIQEELRKK